MWHLAGAPWSFGALLMAALGAYAAPSVNIDMQASFSAGPYLLELLYVQPQPRLNQPRTLKRVLTNHSETAAGENSSAYFPLLDRIAEGKFALAKNDAELYQGFLDLLRSDGHITSDEAFSTFNLALSLRSAAPRIETHYQFYSTAVEPQLGHTKSQDCVAWVQVNHQRFCDPVLEAPQDTGNLS
jgi:UDP-glucose:glycoprotein glucosyltransferase